MLGHGYARNEVSMNPGASSPCVFHRSDVDGSRLVHGGVFVIVTRGSRAKEIEKHLRSQWDVEVQTLGPTELKKQNTAVGKPTESCTRRSETCSDTGQEESDKQGAASQHARGGTRAPEEIKSFRADAARANYLSMDMSDLPFSAKEISRATSKPKKDQRSIVNMTKYLKDLEKRRVKQKFKFDALDTVHFADPVGRARQVELYRPTLGSSAGVPRRGWWRCRRVRQSCIP